MSTLITPSNLLEQCDQSGIMYADFLPGLDAAIADAATLVSNNATIFAGDANQQYAWYSFLSGLTGSPSPVSTLGSGVGSSPFGGAGYAGGAFGNGSALLNRQNALQSIFASLMRGMSTQIALYGPAVNVSILDLISYAAHYNITPYTVLYSPHFAAAYWFAYGASTQMLPPSCVFAPAGIVLATAIITGVNTASHVFKVWPSANGYTSPAPTTDGNGNNVYLGGMPNAQAFAPIKTSLALVTSDINGTCALTVHAPNQANVSATFTATLDNATASTSVNLTPSTGGDRINGAITAIAVAGTATAGAFSIETGAPERSGT